MMLRKARAALTAHVGGNPSATQRALIDHATMLTLHLHMLDEKALRAAGVMTEHDSRTYLAWNNSLTRTLRELGLKGAPEKVPSLADIMARPSSPIAAE